MASAPEKQPIAAATPPPRPMAVAHRVSLFQREIHVSLSSAAMDILFGAAMPLSEGQQDGDRFFGSTMVTIDLGRAAELVSDPCDESSARRIAELLETDERVLERARELAYSEAQRLAGGQLSAVQIDLTTRRTGIHLQLDMDIEASVEDRA